MQAGMNPVKAVNAKCVHCKLHIANLTSDSSIHSPNHSQDGVWGGGCIFTPQMDMPAYSVPGLRTHRPA
jgi:hypothetical protein